mgnify:FL=1
MKAVWIRSGLGLAAMLCAASLWADAPTREAELEARVAELERLVEQLLEAQGHQAQRQEAMAGQGGRHAEVEQRLTQLEQDKADRPAGSGTEFEFSGFIKHDMMMTRYSGGTVPPNNLIRDFYVPALVPVGGESSTTDFDTNVRQSRFIFNVLRPDEGLQAYLEMDFSANTGGNERLTNTTSPNVRQAFLRWNDVLIGQAWTTFFNVGALPENLDFIGPSEGTIFARQSQVRWTKGNWQFAIENPETTVTPFGGGARIVTDTASVPDFVARYNHSGDWGSFTIAGLGRQLAIDRANGTDRQTAFALSLSGKFNLGNNDFRWMASGGSGIGRYLGLNTANDAVLNANNALDTIDAYGGFVSYRHHWNDRWRSNFTYSMFQADNDTDLTGSAVTESASSAHVNLIYQATPHLRFGMEYIHANREVESGASGNMNRVQFTTILGF